ncbi:Rib/alpha-like domain-containing protein, partial [Corynebacterium caspium]
MSRSSRRGISIAIGALTVTMAMAMQTAPFVTNAPFAAVAMAQQTQAAATGAINSPAVSNTDVFTVNGSVREIREYGISASAIHNKNSRAIPGTKVYFQWKEGEHGQFTSPVYYAEADADGNFSIFAKPFFDSNGNIHTFDAKYALDAANADFTNEKVRIWSELPAASTENYRLSYAYGSSWSPAAGDNTSDGATWIEANKRLDDVKIQYTKRVAPGSMHLLDRSKWADENNQPAVTDLPNSPMSPGADSTQGLIGGLAYWNLNPAAAAANFAAYNDVAQTLQTLQPGDIPANGTMVVASYLSDKAVTAIEAHVATAFPGKTLRGADWTVDDEETLQDWIRTQVAADQSWIAETVFNNITGSTWHIRGKISNYWTRFTGIYDTTGELAPARNIGRFDGVKGAEGTKHINTDWLYVDFPDLPTDTGVLGGWSLPRYAPVNSEFSPNTSTLFASYPVNFGFIPLKLDFQVANYNSILGTAVPGDIAKTTGINVPIDGNITYKVEWLDGEGTPVAGAECAGLKPSAAGILPSCDFQVPPNLQKDTTYIAVLSTVDKNGNKVELTRDSFTALVPKSRPFAIGSVGTNYTDSATTATPSSVSAPLPNIADPVAAGVTYSIAEALPEGLTLNPQTGHIEGIPTTPGAHIFTVTQTVPNSAFGGKAEDTTQRKYVLSLDITQTILPAGVVGHEYKNADGSAVDVKKLIKGLPDSGITTATGEKVPVTVNVTAVENLPAGLSFDAATGTIVGTPTAEGTFKDPIVVYDITFPQGAVRPNITGHRDKTEIVVTPQPLTELADPSYASMDVPRGTTATTAPPTYVNPITNAETTAPAGTKYALGPGAPNGATIDENTGVVTYPVPIGIKFDTAIKIPVTVTYPDSTTDNPEVEIVAKASTADKLNPSIPAGTAKPGNNATTTPVLQTADGTNTPIPAGTQCSLGPNPPAGATIDATTCVVTMPIPADSTTGTAYNVPVVLTYPDGSSEAATAPFTTAPMDKEVFIPSYAPVDGKRGLPAEIPVTVVAPDGTPAVVPTGTVYSLGEGAPEGATIDPVTGKISMVVPLDADTNTLINVPVVVTYPDKSVNNVTAKLQPIFSEADVNDPTWTPVNAMPGEPVSLPLSATPLPQGTTGVVKDDQGNVIGKVLA